MRRLLPDNSRLLPDNSRLLPDCYNNTAQRIHRFLPESLSHASILTAICLKASKDAEVLGSKVVCTGVNVMQ